MNGKNFEKAKSKILLNAREKKKKWKSRLDEFFDIALVNVNEIMWRRIC